MGLLRKALRFDPGGLPEAERNRFHAFAFAKQRTGWALLTLGMPLLFVVGWLRDYFLLGPRAERLLWVRLALAATLLATALSMQLPRGRRQWGKLAVAYVALFAVSIVVLTAIEPAKLSLTHVATMLMLIIMLPFALWTRVAVGMVLALCGPMFALLGYFHVGPGMWLAYLLFSATGIAIGIAQRNANLNASLEIFRHRQRLLHRLRKDSLTGLDNREGWELGLQRLYRSHVESNAALTVLFLDMDHFKAINDRHGHAAGDDLLRNTGEILRRTLRDADLAARVGGEEFLVLLPETDANGAHAIAERLRIAVETMPCEVRTTLSIGLAEFLPGETPESAMQRADHALLLAKRQGRNRVVRA